MNKTQPAFFASTNLPIKNKALVDLMVTFNRWKNARLYNDNVEIAVDAFAITSVDESCRGWDNITGVVAEQVLAGQALYNEGFHVTFISISRINNDEAILEEAVAYYPVFRRCEDRQTVTIAVVYPPEKSS